jgi:uncharacterized LabA/DUF88 family protein
MERIAVFVDLPNFYSDLLRSRIADSQILRDYFFHWLDLDLLATALTGGTLTGIWVFYSGQRIGPKSQRIAGQELDNYIDRINSLEGVTARDVNIPGRQRAHARLKCEHCGKELVGEWLSEKGIDASLTVHLFDTMDSWDVAYLLSGDADFVPVVSSLRRRGKIVVGAGFANRSQALVRECYHYIDLVDVFLKEDVAAYTIFGKDGIAQEWLASEIHCVPESSPLGSLTFEIFIEKVEHQGMDCYTVTCLVTGIPHERNTTEYIDLSERDQRLDQFAAKFPSRIYSRFKRAFLFGPVVWEGVWRRRQEFISSVKGLQADQPQRLRLSYRYDYDARKYEPVVD